MIRTRIVAGDHKGEDMRGIATSLGQRPTLAPYQNRTCTRCGEHTIFVLDDPAGGWYAASSADVTRDCDRPSRARDDP